MPLGQLDDRLHRSRKIRIAGPDGMGLWCVAITLCNDNLTDGRLDIGDVEGLATGLGVGPKRVRSWSRSVAAKLVEAGLWEVEEEGRSWVFHDWADYNYTKAEVLERRLKAAASANLRWGPAGHAKRIADRTAKGNAFDDAKRNATRARSGPGPVRGLSEQREIPEPPTTRELFPEQAPEPGASKAKTPKPPPADDPVARVAAFWASRRYHLGKAIPKPAALTIARKLLTDYPEKDLLDAINGAALDGYFTGEAGKGRHLGLGQILSQVEHLRDLWRASPEADVPERFRGPPPPAPPPTPEILEYTARATAEREAREAAGLPGHVRGVDPLKMFAGIGDWRIKEDGGTH